jgi:hypothetical protein
MPQWSWKREKKHWEERGIVDSEVAKIYKTSRSVATEESQSVVHIPEKGTEE